MLLANIMSYDKETGVINLFGAQFDIAEILIKSATILCVIIAIALILKLGNKIIDKIVQKQIEKNKLFSIDERKLNTLGTLLKSILRYATYIIGIISIAGIIVGGSLPIAFASIGGVAIGLGAQSLVKDIINGVFILFENQYNVGDYITIDKYTGIVESIEIRSTTLREFSGSYHIIPNGLVNVVTNHSRGNMQIRVEVSIAYEQSIDKAIAIIQGACERFKEENEDATCVPNVVGVTALAASGVTIRVQGEVKAMNQWKLEAKLRQMIKEALDENGVEIPYNKVQIMNMEKESLMK